MSAYNDESAAGQPSLAKRGIHKTPAQALSSGLLSDEQMMEINAALPELRAIGPAQNCIPQQRALLFGDQRGCPWHRTEQISLKPFQAGPRLIAMMARQLAHHIQQGGHVSSRGRPDRRCRQTITEAL